MSVFSKRLKTIRYMHEWTQSDVAKRAHMLPNNIAQFETDARKPSFDILCRLAIALEVNTDYLLGLSDIPLIPQKTYNTLYNDFKALYSYDRTLVQDFIKMLLKRTS